MRWLPHLLMTMPLLGGCSFLRTATVPMPAAAHAAPAPDANGLIVMLPGFGDGPAYYEQNGFVEMVRAANPRFDVVCADAHFGYYRGFTIVDRLHADVIGPVAERYEHVWIVGISMGGLGAAAYAIEHPELVDGVILLAPYMGSRAVIEEIVEAGGLAKWQPPALASIEDDETRKYYELWSWYQRFLTDPAHMPKLFLGHGEDDGLGTPNALVGSVLPAGHYRVRPGGHKWTVWAPLFAEFAPHVR